LAYAGDDIVKCYDHPEVEAVGVCAHCGRGLCAESAVEIGKRTACKGRCEGEVAAMNAAFTRQQRQGSQANLRSTAFMFLVFSLIFLFFPMFDTRLEESFRVLQFEIGGVLFVIAVVYFNAARRTD
jgi:hypothetical protein